MLTRLLCTFCTLLTALLFCTLPASAQTTLRGRVTDAQTGDALPAATLQIEGTYQGTVTNVDGRYELRATRPVTLVVRFIGYESARRTVNPGDPPTQDFDLRPVMVELDELVVTDEDPAVNIIRKVIERKQEWMAALETWKADAYTRFTARNDTGIVAISESISEAFWDRERGFKEVARGTRNTENLDLQTLLPAAVFVRNLYNDDVEIAGYTFIGPTHPDALKHYRFKLEGFRQIDDQTVYDISVTPRSKLQSAFVGRVSVLDEAYALLEVELEPNESFLFPVPIQGFRIRYEQQFSNFGRDFWLPVDFRSRGALEIGIPGARFPTITFDQVSRLTDYEVNRALPDSLFETKRFLFVDSTAVKAGTAFTELTEIVPLSVEETAAYDTIDSTLTLAKAYEPTGPLARLIRVNMSDDDDEGNAGPNRGGGGRGNRLDFSFTPQLWFNRVDAAHLGLKASPSLGDRVRLSAEGGYATGTRDWTYGGGLEVRLGKRERLRLGVDYRAGSDTRYGSAHYTRFTNTMPPLLGGPDYFDYYRNEGWRATGRYRLAPLNTTLALQFRDETHTSLRTTSDFNLIGDDKLQRFNPPVDEGTLRSVTVLVNVGNEFVPVTGNRRAELTVEHAADAFSGDFAFTRFRLTVDWRFPTFLKRRLLPNVLDVRLVGGTSAGTLPVQRFDILEGTLAAYSPPGTFKTLRGVPYEGEHQLGIFWEHHFRTVPFELLGWRRLAQTGTSLSLHGGHGRTWIARETRRRLDYSAFFPSRFHQELGLSLTNLFGFPVRIDATKRLDAHGFFISLGIGRLF